MESNAFLKLDGYEKQTRIGIGGFGEVFKLLEKTTGKIFAAKISLIDISEDQKDEKSLIIELTHEVNILAQLNHPAILKFIGYSPTNFKNEPRPVIITEYVSNGSLKDIIQLEQKSQQPELWNDTKKLINIYGIASAMAYLHSHNIIHRDLKTGNILEDDYLFPKIADFGLSKIYHSNEESMSAQSTKELKGTPKYVAPESWESYEYTKEGDVYSYSFIVYQILTHEEPFKNFNMQMLYSQVVKKGFRPEFPEYVAPSYRELISQCWSSKPTERPTFSEIVTRLKTDEGFMTDKVDKEKYLYYINMIDNYQTTYDPRKKFKKVALSNLPNKIQEKQEEPQIKIHLSNVHESSFSKATPAEDKNVALKTQDNKENSSILDEVIKMPEFSKLNEETQEFLKQTLNNQTRNANDKTIKIPPNKTILLYANESFTTPEFIKILKLFNQINIEIKYPSNVFEAILKDISNLIQAELKTIQIHITITALSKIKTSLQNLAFPVSISLEAGIDKIDECSFERCTSITSISIPTSVTTICSSSFSGCSKLTEISIPNTVKRIGSYAFSGCSKLSLINIPNFVEFIGKGTFSFCSKLMEITIPANAEFINESLFEECCSLEKISFTNDCKIKTIGPKSFKGCIKVSKIELPATITVIESKAFENCTSLSEISIPTSVIEIKENSFGNCKSLKKISFNSPSSLSFIGDKAFCLCSSLESFCIPNTVNDIGNKIFEGCSNLREIRIPSTFKKLFLNRHFGIDKNVNIIKI